MTETSDQRLWDVIFTPKSMISLAFALHAIQVGSLISRLPEVQRDLALGEFEFSLVLMAATLGFLLSTPFTDQVIRKLGIKPTFHIFFLFCTVVQAIAVLMPSGIGLGAACFLPVLPAITPILRSTTKPIALRPATGFGS
ncbi:MAG: hypothetical protein HOM03_16110 [Marinovum sp.]|nr:hypothetical protein [Marinovum sp.]MBT6097642.1 hypothetical protein [Marinovum sp.]MBT6534472.1 hypothetical protein [Marinovum sp.]MDG2230115.1 hypothetical protein [Paracoccaceae bacterium]